MGLSLLFSSLLAATAQASAVVRATTSHTVKVDGQEYACKCFPGDSCWPSTEAWSKLNMTVEGNLRSVTPPGNVCFKSFKGQSTYNAEKCTETTANNLVAAWVVKDPTHVMWPFYTNNTCDAAANQQDKDCTIGYYPEYVIIAKKKEHIIAGVKFARENNMRLVIRNTGHDFMGRSTGRGSLAINTHSFQDINFIKKYTGAGNWDGGAVTVGAGVMFRDLYPLAFKRNVVVIGGECPTVGIAGGYIQGGGHGPLSGFHGLAIDNVLSFDVVTANGDFVTANSEQNPDLFWALKGGGPSTFGVVTSLTVKTHPEIPTIAMLLNVTSSNPEKFWKGVTHFRQVANPLANAGMYVWFAIRPGTLTIQPIVGLNMTRAEFDKVTQPLVDRIRMDEIPFRIEVREFKTFYEMYDYAFAKTDDTGGNQSLMGGRVLVQEDFEKHEDEILAAIKNIIDTGNIYAGHVVNPGHRVPNSDTPAHPAWRKAASADIYIVPVKAQMTVTERKTAEDTVTNALGKPLRDASPNSASYVNEGDVNEPEWQEVYWGSNYPKLLELKKKYDPKGLFYAKATPGTEDWSEILDGKLCKRV
ncbi:FAD binding domain-containing protein [Zopfia rhizophila CBS 207.26]|uniref:FAD binding domain-containing protein n=1 Tax=Zopfia rhizophila CBS 207.26 TaxID=1314779 RepID=A0A6A6DAB9_9PEZI|nr:FAD binding domain-containing protein [Zopfia rhizophila CBS 207.26]